MSWPSIRRPSSVARPSASTGTGSPVRRSTVGRMSIVIAGAVQTLPAGITPGSRARHGTRTPPSNTVPFPSRRFPALPA